jgi:hypothetical protein
MHLLLIVSRVKSCSFDRFDICLAGRIDTSLCFLYFHVQSPSHRLVRRPCLLLSNTLLFVYPSSGRIDALILSFGENLSSMWNICGSRVLRYEHSGVCRASRLLESPFYTALCKHVLSRGPLCTANQRSVVLLLMWPVQH